MTKGHTLSATDAFVIIDYCFPVFIQADGFVAAMFYTDIATFTLFQIDTWLGGSV